MVNQNLDNLNNLVYEYYKYLNLLSNDINCDIYTFIKPDKKWYQKCKSVNYTAPGHLYNSVDKRYREFIEQLQSTNKTDIALLFKDFAVFLVNMEKCFLYNNDSTNIIHSEIDEIKQEYKLIIDCDQYSIVYEFNVSAINMPGSKAKFSNPLAFMDDIIDNDDKVIFINVFIERSFGKNMINEYKFIQGSAPILEDISDVILYDNIINISKKIIIDSLIDILDNNVCEMSLIKEKVKVEEILKHESIQLWRR